MVRDLGNAGDSLVKRIYGHLGMIRYRAEVVGYRVEYHRGVLGGRLRFVENRGLVRGRIDGLLGGAEALPP